jgi:hypothetical protein
MYPLMSGTAFCGPVVQTPAPAPSCASPRLTMCAGGGFGRRGRSRQSRGLGPFRRGRRLPGAGGGGAARAGVPQRAGRVRGSVGGATDGPTSRFQRPSLALSDPSRKHRLRCLARAVSVYCWPPSRGEVTTSRPRLDLVAIRPESENQTSRMIWVHPRSLILGAGCKQTATACRISKRIFSISCLEVVERTFDILEVFLRVDLPQLMMAPRSERRTDKASGGRRTVRQAGAWA